MIDGMFVMDSHTHCYKPAMSIWGVLGQTHEQLILRMDRNGIDVSVIMGQHRLDPGEQWDQTEYLIEGATKYPGRFVPVMTYTPFWGKRTLDDMRRGNDLGVRGLKLYTHGQGFYPLDSPMLDPMIALAIEFDWVVMMHTDIDSKVCSPHLGLRLAKRHPTAKIQFSHMGMNSDITSFMPEWCREYENVYLDTSDTPNLPNFVYKLPMETMPDRLLFGTDGPTLYEEVELCKLAIAERDFGLTKEEKRKILGLNGARLWGIEPKGQSERAARAQVA
jgi:predicted TIM-barrel fold metal-dependent hydrolase